MSDPAKYQPLPPDLADISGPSAPRDPTRQIFVNRNMNMARIETVGFDMDYTLAPYHQHAMDALSIQATVSKLIANKGYPQEVHDARLDHAFIIRGLAVAIWSTLASARARSIIEAIPTVPAGRPARFSARVIR